MPNFTSELSARVPFLLLPVRVQTKFMQPSEEATSRSRELGIKRYKQELLVRIYPDQISINRHEEELTASEIEAGWQYWQQALVAPDRQKKSPHSLLAWQVLIAKYGASRGYWIVQALTPRNLAELIEKRESGEKNFEFDFPPTEAYPSWQRAAHATCLPDRFVVSLYRRYKDSGQVKDSFIREQLLDNNSITPMGGYFNYEEIVDLTSEFLELTKEVVGLDIHKDLPVGLNPGAMTDGQSGELNDDQGISGELAWLADFDQAVLNGMGIIVELTEEEYKVGFNRLVVLGVREKSEPDESMNCFAALLRGHHYTDGLQLVPQGTPTNNTGGESAGYSSAEQVDAESTFRTYWQDPLYKHLDPDFRRVHRDGQRLVDALGLPAEEFAHVAHADGTDGTEALLLNRLLWPATFGYFMRERLQPLLGPGDAIERTRQFFEEYVTGRGLVPALRVGNEPYGILPTTQYSQWQAPKSLEGYGERLWEIIRRLDTTWTERLNQAVHYPSIHYEAPYPVGAPYRQDFLTILGQEAASIEFYQRYWIGPNLIDTLAEQAGTTQSLWPSIDTGGISLRRRNTPARFGTPALSSPPRSAQPINPLFEEFVGFFDPQDRLGFSSAAWPRMFDVNFQSGYRRVVHTYANEPNPVPQVNGSAVDEAQLSERNPVQPFVKSKRGRNFIHWLSDSTFDQIRVEDFSGEYPPGEIPAEFQVPNSLLYRLLRQAVMLRYWEAAAVTLQGAAAVPEQEAEFFNVFAKDTARWDWLYYPATFIGSQPLYLYLQAGNGPAGSQLAEYLKQLNELATLPTARLERLLAEHLDLGNHRIDTWKTAQVMVRLLENRREVPSGSYLGAFGWLEDVVRQDQSQLIEDSKLRYDPDNLGYIHAPTINHGVAAAVLRQGYKSRQFEPNPALPAANRMAVNLSSERVRRAQAVLEGIRTGGSLAAILGRDFEDGLFRATPLNTPSYSLYAEKFRQRFPFASEKALLGQPAQASMPAPEQAARQIVNGLALAQFPRPTAYPPYGVNLTGTPTDAEKAQFLGTVQGQSDNLRDTLDAIGDLTVGESIYQAVMGNVEQAGAMLENVAKGKFPASPDIVHPSHSGVTLTHRVLLHLGNVEASQSTSWGTLTPLARAEPSLNAWLVPLLGDPAAVRFHYTYVPNSTQATPTQLTGTLRLDQVGLQPVDLLYLFDNEPLQAGSSLDVHLSHLLRQPATSDASGTGPVTIQYAHADVQPLRNLLPLLGRLRQLLATSRPAGPMDLAGPSFLSPGQVSADGATVLETEVRGRLTSIVTELTRIKGELETQLTPLVTAAAATPPVLPTATQTKALRGKLYELGLYGFGEAYQAAAPANVNLVGSAQSVLQALNRRLLAAAQVSESGEVLTKYAEQAKALLGPAFRISLQFNLLPEAAAAYREADRNASKLLQGHPDNPLLLDEWLQGLAPVREPLDHLEKAMMLNELLWEDSPQYAALKLRPVQLSQRPAPAGGEYWLGMSYPDSYNPPADAVSLVQLLPADYVADSAQRALWLDEWVEVIPHKQQDTSVVFHYDQPNSEAPQTLLLAVAPRPDEIPKWQWEHLLGAVNETLDLAKKRAVEPGSLAFTHLGTLLPAVVAPVAQEAVTMTLDFRRLNGTAQFREEPLASGW